MKGKYSRFRELWAVPKYKILFKLSGWLLFFVLFFLIYAMGDHNQMVPEKPVNNQPVVSTFEQMKEHLTTENLRITYYITADETFFIEGTLIEGLIEGTLETNEIHRIRISEENVYLIRRDVAEPSLILDGLNLTWFFPQNILDIINNDDVNLRKSDDERIIFYTSENFSISVHTNEEKIYKIVILDGNITYELEYSAI